MDPKLDDTNEVYTIHKLSTSEDLPNTTRNISSDSEVISLRSTLTQITTMFIFGIFVIGNTVVTAMPTIVIGALLNNDKEDFSLNENDASWFGSIIYGCHPFATLLSGFCQDTFGRKRTLQAVNIPILIGWVLIYFSTSVVYLDCAAILLGVTLGFIEAPALSYIGEISEPRLRGIMCISTGVFGSIGMLLESLIGALTDWRTTCAISAAFAVAAIIALTLIPESPVWLLIKNRTSEAEKSLCRLRGWVHPSKVREEFLSLQEYAKSSNAKKNEKITGSNNSKGNYT
ncbi:facilitated trehalose transporter Tret1-like [Lycorma delicatula]|uniref:facilitated trehalose transporter Tret1-like n=1 Tax=Lycorma delicatula TaxID=130591 RepID=UPI003F514B95